MIVSGIFGILDATCEVLVHSAAMGRPDDLLRPAASGHERSPASAGRRENIRVDQQRARLCRETAFAARVSPADDAVAL